MKILSQSILTHTEGVIAHGVNCCGVIGAGVAKVIAERYPVVRKDYFAKFTNENKIYPEFLGTIQLVQINEQLDVANLFIQGFYGRTLRCYNDNPQQLDYGALDKCLDRVFDLAQGMGRPLGLSKIGCGLAGGDFGIVESFIRFYEKKYSVQATIYDPESKQ